MKVLLLGGTGFLGRNLMQTCPANVHLLHPIRQTLELLNTANLVAYLDKHRPDIIVNVAAVTGGISFNSTRNFALFLANLELELSIFRAILESQSKVSLATITSSCLYPRSAEPWTESQILEGEAEITNIGYAEARRAGIVAARLANSETPDGFRHIVTSNLYGPFDHKDAKRSHFVAAAIEKVRLANSSKEKLVTIGGRGQAKRELTYAPEFCEWVWRTLPNMSALPDVINVGSGEELSVLQVFELVSEALSAEVRFQHDLSFPEGAERKLLDSSVARTEFSWDPQVKFQRGIGHVLESWDQR